MERHKKIVKYFRNNYKSLTIGLTDYDIIELALAVKFNVNRLR
jgi:hypothetical protein